MTLFYRLEIILMLDIKPIEEKDIDMALNIYNSNSDFLYHHLGRDNVDESFLVGERKEMSTHGFMSNFVIMNAQPVGIIDYMQNKEGYVYLSLLMLSMEYQNKGFGKVIYRNFEGEVRGNGATKIRIDVVDDYENNVIPFWEKMGFHKIRKDELTWGDKTSSVTVMEKNFDSKSF